MKSISGSGPRSSSDSGPGSSSGSALQGRLTKMIMLCLCLCLFTCKGESRVPFITSDEPVKPNPREWVGSSTDYSFWTDDSKRFFSQLEKQLKQMKSKGQLTKKLARKLKTKIVWVPRMESSKPTALACMHYPRIQSEICVLPHHSQNDTRRFWKAWARWQAHQKDLVFNIDPMHPGLTIVERHLADGNLVLVLGATLNDTTRKLTAFAIGPDAPQAVKTWQKDTPLKKSPPKKSAHSEINKPGNPSGNKVSPPPLFYFASDLNILLSRDLFYNRMHFWSIPLQGSVTHNRGIWDLTLQLDFSKTNYKPTDFDWIGPEALCLPTHQPGKGHLGWGFISGNREGFSDWLKKRGSQRMAMLTGGFMRHGSFKRIIRQTIQAVNNRRPPFCAALTLDPAPTVAVEFAKTLNANTLMKHLHLFLQGTPKNGPKKPLAVFHTTLSGHSAKVSSDISGATALLQGFSLPPGQMCGTLGFEIDLKSITHWFDGFAALLPGGFKFMIVRSTLYKLARYLKGIDALSVVLTPEGRQWTGRARIRFSGWEQRAKSTTEKKRSGEKQPKVLNE